MLVEKSFRRTPGDHDEGFSTSHFCVFTPSTTGFAGSGYASRDFHRTSLTCPQIKHRSTHRAGSRPCSEHRSVATQVRQRPRESLCCLQEKYVMTTIDCKQRASA